MPLTIERRQLQAQAPAREHLRQVSVKGDRAAFLQTDGRIDVVSLETGERIWSRTTRSEPAHVRLSRTGRHLLVFAADRLSCELWSVDQGVRIAGFEREGRTPQPLTVSFMVDRAGRELFLLSRKDMVLESFAAHDATRIFSVDCRNPLAYHFTALVPMADGDTVIAIGCQASEGKDSFYRFSLGLCVSDPDLSGRMEATNREPADYAYRVAAGPCGSDALVAFRDPEDDETLEDDERPRDALHSFKGLYVRRLGDLEVVERIPYDAPLATGAILMGTEDAIVVDRGREVDLVERGQGDHSGLVTSLGDAIYILEPFSGVIYSVRPGANVEAISFHR